MIHSGTARMDQNFPYPAVMLWIMSLPRLVLYWTNFHDLPFNVLMFDYRLPLILADLVIFTGPMSLVTAKDWLACLAVLGISDLILYYLPAWAIGCGSDGSCVFVDVFPVFKQVGAIRSPSRTGNCHENALDADLAVCVGLHMAK